MTANDIIQLLERFEYKASGHSTIGGAMVAAFGIDYDKEPLFVELEKYIAKCMTYDTLTGEWY